MRLSRLFSWIVFCVSFAVVHTADCAEPEAAKPQEGFAIVRDPTLGCPLILWRTPPKDADGHKAVDIVEQFLKHVRDGEVDRAKKLCRFSVWTSIDRDTIGDVTPKGIPSDPEYAQRAQEKLDVSESMFPKFVEELRRAKKYTLGATVPQKSVYWSMRVVADGTDKQPWPYALNLCYVDEKWEILITDLDVRYRELAPAK